MAESKGIALAILKAKKPEGSAADDKPEGDDMGAETGLMSAADEIIESVKAGDAKGLVEALKSFVQMAGDGDEPESEPEGE